MQKLSKTITIGITSDDRAAVRIEPDVTAADALQLLGTLALHILSAYRAIAVSNLNIAHNSGNTPKSQKLNNKELQAAITGITESMYDAANSVFSTVLTQFYPEAPRNSLDEEAIIQLTNQLIEERYEKLTPKEKHLYKKNYDAVLAKLQTEIKTKTKNTKEQQTDVESKSKANNRTDKES